MQRWLTCPYHQYAVYSTFVQITYGFTVPNDTWRRLRSTTAIDKTSLVPKMQARKMIEFKIQSKMFSCINIYNIQ